MDLLVPCAGRSSRFSTRRPKYLLTMPDGRLMVEAVLDPFRNRHDRLLFAVLREHDERFGAAGILEEIFPESETLIIDELTRGEADTVRRMIEHFGTADPFLVKDSDSYFQTSEEYEPGQNYISICNARKTPNVKLHNKSFVEVSEQNYIVRTEEKEISSKLFSCGGYFFSSPAEFIEGFERYEGIQTSGEYFLSGIIDVMIDSGIVFHPIECTDYEDWGTYEDWVSYMRTRSTYFLDIDGVVYENGSRYWQPRWGENRILEASRDEINRLYDGGNMIILVTSRPESYREKTLSQLQRDGVRFHQLIMGILHGRRIIINDYSATNPYPSAQAINTKRDSTDFVEKLAGC